MRVVLCCLLVLVCVFSWVVGVEAVSYYYETSIILDGEWNLNRLLTLPEVSSTTVLEGNGRAEVRILLISEDPRSLADWWKLF